MTRLGLFLSLILLFAPIVTCAQLLTGFSPAQKISISYNNQYLWENAHSVLQTTLRFEKGFSLYALHAIGPAITQWDYYGSERYETRSRHWGGGITYGSRPWQPGTLSFELSVGFEKVNNLMVLTYQRPEYLYVKAKNTMLVLSVSPLWNLPTSNDKIGKVGIALTYFQPHSNVSNVHSEVIIHEKYGFALTANALTSVHKISSSVITIDSQAGVIVGDYGLNLIVRLGVQLGLNTNLF